MQNLKDKGLVVCQVGYPKNDAWELADLWDASDNQASLNGDHL